MPSAYAYTALSPDYADLAQPLQHLGLSVASTLEEEEEEEEEYVISKPRRWQRLHAVVQAAKDVYQRNIGLLLVVGAQALFSLVNLAVKKLDTIDPPMSTLELILVRMVITYICSITYMLSTGTPNPFTGPKGVRLLLVFRGFSGFFGIFGMYFSLQYLSLSDATVLTFLAPSCTAVAGALFLSEKITRKEVIAGLLSLIGVVLIARPPFLFGSHAGDNLGSSSTGVSSAEATPEQRLSAVGIALVGVLGSTGAYTSMSAIGRRAHPLHSLMSYALQSVIVSSIGMVVTKTPFIVPIKLEWLVLLVTIGILAFFAQVLLAMGLARETAGRGTMAIYTLIVFVTILERIFFRTIPSVLSVIGTIVIIASALYVALTKEAKPSSGGIKDSIRLRGRGDDTMERGLLLRDSEDSQHRKALVSPDEEEGEVPDKSDGTPSSEKK